MALRRRFTYRAPSVRSSRGIGDVVTDVWVDLGEHVKPVSVWCGVRQLRIARHGILPLFSALYRTGGKVCQVAQCRGPHHFRFEAVYIPDSGLFSADGEGSLSRIFV
jgi:hypothetical protein